MAERVLKKGMSVNCRTEDEEQVFREFADKEGHRWVSDESLLKCRICSAPCSFQIEYDAYSIFPKSITWSEIDYDSRNIVTQIEASELFRNQLISRRIKYGNTT